MDFEKKVPDWQATGTEPPASLKEQGWQTGYKPPAAFFNWFWNGVSACLKELQEKMQLVRQVVDGGTGKNAVTSGSYLVGNGTNAMNEKTPEEVREHINAAKKNAAIPVVNATSDDGIAYTATVDGITELQNGMIITIVPAINSASTTPTLNVNGLGDKMIRLPLSFNNAAMSTPKLETYISKDRPLTLQYDAAYLNNDGIWKVFGKQKTSAQDLYGTVPVEGGGTGANTAAEALLNLGINNFEIVEFIPAASYSKSAKITTLVPFDASAFYFGRIGYMGTGISTVSGNATDGFEVRGFSVAIPGTSSSKSNVWTAILKFNSDGASQATLSYIALQALDANAVASSSPSSANIGPVYMLRKIN